MRAHFGSVATVVACLASTSAIAQPGIGQLIDGRLLLINAESALAAGNYTLAKEHAQTALELCRKEGESADVRTAEALHVLASIDRRLGRYEQAEQRCQEALALRRAALGAAHRWVALSLELLADIYADRGQIAKLAIAREALVIREKLTDGLATEQVPALLHLARYELGSGGQAGPENARTLAERALRILGQSSEWQGFLSERDLASGRWGLGARLRSQLRETLARAMKVLEGAGGQHPPAQAEAQAQWAALQVASGHLREARQAFRESIRLRFAGLSDEALGQALDLRGHWRFRFSMDFSERLNGVHEEMILVEMARRGGKRCEEILTRSAGSHVEPLTALRRVQGKRDPLTIEVDGPGELECELESLPTFEVRLKNVDEDKSSLELTRGGHYRTGRLERWRLEVVDAHGNIIPCSPSPGGFGGGFFTEGPLAFGEAWETSLAMSSHVEISTPGDYAVTIQYHNQLEIAGLQLIDDLILSKSQPIRLKVKPRAIEVSRGELDQARAALARLDGDQPLKVLAGRYGAHAHDFIAPDSPPGKLLSLGWKAVPVLVDEALRDGIPAVRRAWLCSLLFTITGRLDPRWHEGALGSYDWRETGWAISFGKPGLRDSGGAGYGEGASGDGKADAAAQREIIDAWRSWKQHLVVKVLDG